MTKKLTSSGLKAAANKDHAKVISATTFQVSSVDSPQTPSARFRHASCFIEPYIFVHGGRYGFRAFRDLWRLNLYNNTWEKVEPDSSEFPGLQEEHFFVKYKDDAYLIVNENGYHNLCQIEVWMLNPGSVAWRKLRTDKHYDIPLARSGATGNIVDKKLYVFGGFVILHQRPTNALLEFDLDQYNWKTICPHEYPTSTAPPPLYSHSSVIFEKELYVFGGTAGYRTYSALWKFCLRNKFWLAVSGTKGRSPSARYGHSAIEVGNSMWVYGGQNEHVIHNDLWRYDFPSRTWTEFQVTGCPPLAHHTALISAREYTDESRSTHPDVSSYPNVSPFRYPRILPAASIPDIRQYARTISQEPLIIKSKISDKARYQYDNDAIELTDIKIFDDRNLTVSTISNRAKPITAARSTVSTHSLAETESIADFNATENGSSNTICMFLIGGNTANATGLPKPLTVYTLRLPYT